jgi:hypothetical protein
MTVFAFGYCEVTGRTNQYATKEQADFLQGEFKVSRWFEGAWNKRFDFIFAEIFQPVNNVGGFPVYGILARYPDYPAALATGIEITGRGSSSDAGNDGQVSWERALIRVDYSTVPALIEQGSPEEGNPLYIEETIDAHLEMLTVKGEDVAKVADDEKLHDKGAQDIVIVMATIGLTELFRINPNWNVVGSLLGKVNSVAVQTPSGFNVAAGNLRYDGPSAKTQVLVADFQNPAINIPEIWNIAHRFEFNRHGWNNKLVDGEWVEVKHPVTGGSLYETDDLRKIFFNV